MQYRQVLQFQHLRRYSYTCLSVQPSKTAKHFPREQAYPLKQINAVAEFIRAGSGQYYGISIITGQQAIFF